MNLNYLQTTNDAPCQAVQQTVRKRLELKKTYLTEALAEVTAALTLLDANPGFEALQDAITRAL